MKWSWKIARVAGIDVYIHATFLILLIWLGMVFWNDSGSILAVVNGLAFILALFGCVLLHEYGHALTARHYGIQTRNIVLLPIGGVAALEGMPKDPRQEIRVALAGPMVNFLIAVLLWLMLAPGTSDPPLSLVQGSFLERLMIVNIVLAVFNLLPAFPMDGGRVLRALLAMWLNRTQATQIAANVGQLMALGFGFLGLLYNPFLLFIALFVWIGAVAEASAERMKLALYGATAGQAMLQEYHTLSTQNTLQEAVNLTLKTLQKDFPIENNGKLVGVLSQVRLLEELEKHNESTPIERVQLESISTVDIHTPLEDLLTRMQGSSTVLVAVQERGQVVGIVDLDNIMELIKIHNAVEQHQGSAETRR